MATDPQALAGTAIAASAGEEDVIGLAEAANDVVGVIANWFQVITTLAPLISNAVSDGPDAITVLNQIRQRLNDLLQLVQGLIVQTKMLEQVTAITAARDRLNTLLLEGKSGPDVTQSKFFGDAQDAVNIFAADIYWKRPYVPSYAYSNRAFPNNGPPHRQL
jgi:hypothetical protein